MAESVILQFSYTQQDYVRAMRLHLANRMNLRLDVAVAVGLALLSGWFWWRNGAGGTGWIWVAAAVASGVLLGIVLLAYFVVPVRAFRSQPKLHAEYRLEFSRAGVQFRTANIDSRIEWKLYRELRSDANVHLLLYGDGFTAIPRRVFSSAAHEAAFVELVRQSLPSRPGK